MSTTTYTRQQLTSKTVEELKAHWETKDVLKMDDKELSEFCEYILSIESQALRSAYNNKRLELARGLKY